MKQKGIPLGQNPDKRSKHVATNSTKGENLTLARLPLSNREKQAKKQKLKPRVWKGIFQAALVGNHMPNFLW